MHMQLSTRIEGLERHGCILENEGIGRKKVVLGFSPFGGGLGGEGASLGLPGVGGLKPWTTWLAAGGRDRELHQRPEF